MDAQDFRSLQEAYIGVYDDDIREKLEFESWVNNLLEEGYDLSDYTWDELYENYTQLDEISDRRVQQTLRARERRFNNSIDSGAPNKEFHQLRNTERLVASRNKRTGSNIKVDENHQLDEAIRNLESRKKLRSIMDREVVKGDKSKGQNPRMKYHTKTGDQAFGLLINRDETGSKGNPVRSRGGMADSASPTRDRGAGNKAARKVGKSVPNTRDVDESYDQQLDEVSDRRVAAVGKRRENVVSKAFNNYTNVSEKPGGTQKLATDISKLNRFKNLEKKRDRRINKESYDLYDIILSHLIDEGYADTQEAAERIMVNMSEEWRESIVETRMDPRGRPASGPMNVYANPKGKPSQARLDAIKSYEDEQRKKTPEQRAQELADYKERQMNR